MPKFKLLSPGERFGLLTVVGPPEIEPRTHPSGKRSSVIRYPVSCDCGSARSVEGRALVHGGARSCGCLRRRHGKRFTPEGSAHFFPVGTEFGLLTVTGPPEYRDYRLTTTGQNQIHTYYECQCKCGQKKVIFAGSLSSGRSRSCGCGQKKSAGQFKRTHGMTGTRLYKIWASMVARCKPAYASYNPRYAGRGIAVCDKWKQFERFKEWAMSNGYQDHLTIDRIDSDGDYEPGNCRWATMLEQGTHTSRSRLITEFGQTKCATEWTRDPRCSISDMVLRARLTTGWDVELAITTPAMRKGRKERPLPQT